MAPPRHGTSAITAVRDDHPAARCTSLRLPAPHHLTHGVDGTRSRRGSIRLGLFGLRSHEKFVPAPLFSVPKRQLALFLRHLWATDGCVWWDEKVGQARIYYASTSRRLVDDVAQLLMRFNVMTRVKEIRKGDLPARAITCLIYGAENQLRFLEDIGVHGDRVVSWHERSQEMLAGASRATPTGTPSPARSGTGSRHALAERQMSHRQFAAAIGTQVLRQHTVEARAEPGTAGQGRRRSRRRRPGDGRHQ